jgi:hypothetical protein
LSGVQAAPAVQALHAPSLQTSLVPHAVPLAALTAVSLQVCVPFEQSSVPV